MLARIKFIITNTEMFETNAYVLSLNLAGYKQFKIMTILESPALLNFLLAILDKHKFSNFLVFPKNLKVAHDALQMVGQAHIGFV